MRRDASPPSSSEAYAEGGGYRKGGERKRMGGNGGIAKTKKRFVRQIITAILMKVILFNEIIVRVFLGKSVSSRWRGRNTERGAGDLRWGEEETEGE